MADMKRYIFLITFLVSMLVINGTANACSVINVSDGNMTLVGNNEDGLNTDAKACFLPSEKGEYGTVFFGFDDAWTQGGMNDQGLFLDWATTEHQKIDFSQDKIFYKGNYNILYEGNLNEKILRTCANVNELIDMYKKYNEIAFQDAHVMAVDKTGAAVIIEFDNNELKILQKENEYQFMTNFNITKSKVNGYNCPRYSFLTQSFAEQQEVSADYLKTLLTRVSPPSVEAYGALTAYSNIYDLNNGDIYLYYQGDFNNPIKLNLKDELTKGKHMYDLKTLFHKTQLDIKNKTINNQNLFSYKHARVKIFFFLCLFVAALWPVIYLVSKVRARNNELYMEKGERLSKIISFVNGLLCFILLNGLIKYGFYIRYGFTFLSV